jgi:hypothetical protein
MCICDVAVGPVATMLNVDPIEVYFAKKKVLGRDQTGDLQGAR